MADKNIPEIENRDYLIPADIDKLKAINLDKDYNKTEQQDNQPTNLYAALDSEIFQASTFMKSEGMFQQSPEDLGFKATSADDKEDLTMITEELLDNVFNDSENKGTSISQLAHGISENFKKEDISDLLQDLSKFIDPEHKEGAKKLKILKMVNDELALEMDLPKDKAEQKTGAEAFINPDKGRGRE